MVLKFKQPISFVEKSAIQYFVLLFRLVLTAKATSFHTVACPHDNTLKWKKNTIIHACCSTGNNMGLQYKGELQLLPISCGGNNTSGSFNELSLENVFVCASRLKWMAANRFFGIRLFPCFSPSLIPSPSPSLSPGYMQLDWASSFRPL